MVAKVVIGANFGDEGKGLMTDYFCHQSALRGESSLVVLHNGGAQRGHTVVMPDGERHVFHHFGSGTFEGAPTYLHSTFIVNPIVFRQEWDELKSMGVTPIVYVHPTCRVTTPYDMIANQIVEHARGNAKHGSCGLGIYETIKRYEIRDMISLGKLIHNKDLATLMMSDAKDYMRERLAGESIEVIDKWQNIIESDGIVAHYMDDLEFMISHVRLSYLYQLYYYDCVIFEGGQGLLLDCDNKEYYPHLTPSHTGLKNPFDIISSYGAFTDIEVCYVTRSYLTRHGAGQIDGECPKELINPDMVDLTNIPNPHQGHLRYGLIDQESLSQRIINDFAPAKKLGAKLSLAITHCNEYEPHFSSKFLYMFDKAYLSYGEERASVRSADLWRK